MKWKKVLGIFLVVLVAIQFLVTTETQCDQFWGCCRFPIVTKLSTGNVVGNRV